MRVNSKSIAFVIMFAAIAIGLNVIRVPAIYWPGNFYQFCEIPVVVAFLLFGAKIGLSVGVIHVAGQLMLFNYGPEWVPGYPVAFLALLVMMTGVSVGNWFIKRRVESNKVVDGKRTAIYLTAFGVLFRGGIMPFFDFWVFYRILLPIALAIPIPDSYIWGMMPFFIIFNATVPLYSVSIGYLISTRVDRYLKIKPQAPTKV